MIRSGLALLINWLACVGIVLWLNDATPWLWFALFDAVACVVITVRPAAKMQAIMGAIFVAQIVCHTVYGTSILMGGTPNANFYLGTLDWLSWGNLAVFIMWTGGRFVRLGLSHRSHRRYPFEPGGADIIPPHLASME